MEKSFHCALNQITGFEGNWKVHTYSSDNKRIIVFKGDMHYTRQCCVCKVYEKVCNIFKKTDIYYIMESKMTRL